MFTETETYRNLVGIIVDGPDHMAADIGAAAAGTAPGSTYALHIETEEDHFRFLCFREGDIEDGI